MLCFNCNQALGNVRDDLVVLARLIRYLHAARNTEPKVPVIELWRFAGGAVEVAPDAFWHAVA
jgi:hypothetical protein